jgi:hypothetical protein
LAVPPLLQRRPPAVLISTVWSKTGDLP